jgi:hypothetical protein
MHNETATAVATLEAQAPEIRRLPPVPWRDPHSVSPTELAAYITALEQACADNPHSAGLRTCLGMAHAMNYDVYKSMDALEAAVTLDPGSFWAQMKYGELFYRLRALRRAEGETKKALDLAMNHFELGVARKQLQEIRRLMCEGTQKPEWTGSLKGPAILFAILTIVMCLTVNWK